MSRVFLNVDRTVERYDGVFSRWTIYEKTRLGQIPHRKIGGKIFFDVADLEQWEDGAELETITTSTGRVARPAPGRRSQ